MLSHHLRRVFEQALKASLATPLLFACGGAPGVDTRAFESPVCEGGSIAVSGLMPAQAADYIELRQLSSFGGTDPANHSKLTSSGTLCGGATNVAACTMALMDLKPATGWSRDCFQICMERYLALTDKDAVSAVTTVDALKMFLGTIDTPQEAVLLAFTQPGISISCDDKSRGAVRKTANGWEVIGTDGFACGEGTAVTQHVFEVGSDGHVKELSTTVLERGQAGCAVGRRPCGLLVAYGPRAQTALARHFVAAAHLEAASVPAFLRLRDELLVHGAPRQLSLAAELSARDEVRHARAVSRLARRYGGTPVSPRVTAMPLRALREVARDNAVEGCVRETFGALVANRQALRARDAGIKAELTNIAADETRHALLSWNVHAWAMNQLPREEQRDIRAAQREAVQELRAECAEPVPSELEAEAGMPPADEAVTLVDELQRTLWA